MPRIVGIFRRRFQMMAFRASGGATFGIQPTFRILILFECHFRLPKVEKSGAGFPAPTRLVHFETMTAFWGCAMMSRRKRMHVRSCTTARLAWGAVSAVMAFVTMHINMVLGLAAVLALFSFFYDVRTCTFVNLV